MNGPTYWKIVHNCERSINKSDEKQKVVMRNKIGAINKRKRKPKVQKINQNRRFTKPNSGRQTFACKQNAFEEAVFVQDRMFCSGIDVQVQRDRKTFKDGRAQGFFTTKTWRSLFFVFVKSGNDTQKPMDVMICKVFRSFFSALYLALSFNFLNWFALSVCRPNHSRKNVTWRT